VCFVSDLCIPFEFGLTKATKGSWQQPRIRSANKVGQKGRLVGRGSWRARSPKEDATFSLIWQMFKWTRIAKRDSRINKRTAWTPSVHKKPSPKSKKYESGSVRQ